MELAKARIPVILVARDIDRLNELSQLIEEYYNVPTKVIQSYLSVVSPPELYNENSASKYPVDCLIYNAGVSDTAELIDSNIGSIDKLSSFNAVATTKLCELYGFQMKERKSGRIVVISSIGRCSRCTKVCSLCCNQGIPA